MGSNFEARQAGQRPKTRPTRTEKVKARTTDPGEINIFQLAKADNIQETKLPNNIPTVPPNRQIRTASIKNWIKISLLWAPRSEEHTSELQSQSNLVCPPLSLKKKIQTYTTHDPIPSPTLRVLTSLTTDS